MTATEQAAEPHERRTRGKRAGLDLARIVQAARSLDPDALTMQAVADELGVDRKALNHHVTDREILLELVALDAFSANFTAVHIAANSQWQEACRTFARGFTDSLIAIGDLVNHFPVDTSLVARFMEPTEAVVEKLLEVGFDDETAVRSLVLLTNICMAYARDSIMRSHIGERPRPLFLRRALSEATPQEFANLARIATSSIDTYDTKQLELSIEVFLRGTEALLLRLHETD